MRSNTEVIYFCAHWQAVTLGVAKGNIYRQTIIMQSTAMGWIAHINLHRRVLYLVPHLLLDVHGACSIVYFQAQFGA